VVVRVNTTPVGPPALTFALPQNITTSVQVSDVAVADVNGDGKPDFITTIIRSTSFPSFSTRRPPRRRR